jgi:predicted chitinase
MNNAEAVVALRKIQQELFAVISALEPEKDELEAATPFDKAKFFACYRERFGGLKQAQVAPLEFLLDQLIAQPPDGLREAAYMLATTKHETNDTYEPVREAYWLSEQWRQVNLRYWPYYGRGYVQLTWQHNYLEAGRNIGVNLVDEPDKAMEPAIAYKVMLEGMREGWFTNRKLSDYINERICDYEGARMIINGTDRAVLIAGYAERFELCLRQAEYVA